MPFEALRVIGNVLAAVFPKSGVYNYMAKSDSKDIQKAIVGVVTSGRNLTIQDIARHLNLRPHRVRYYLDQLLAEKKILLARRVNYRVFGYDVINIFFDLPQASAKRGLEFLKKRSETFWLAHNIGPQKFEATLILRDSKEFTRLFHECSAEVGAHLRNPVIANETETRHWGLRYLVGRPDLKPINFHTVPAEVQELDPLDTRIMHFVRKTFGASARQIAVAVGSTQSTIMYRLERLRDWGALSDDIFFCTDDRNFSHGQLVLNLKARTKQHEQAVVDVCASVPQVEGLITGLGCWDHKIILWADSVSHLVDIEASILSTLGKNIAQSKMYVRNRILVGRYE
jgi:DNA-binding Lrp family transcriptional regulator